MINKEDLLLKNYSILSKNPVKNHESIQSIFIQLCEVSPRLAIRCWIELLQANMDVIKQDTKEKDYEYNSFSYHYIYETEKKLLDEQIFRNAVGEFANNKLLLDIIYSNAFISEFANAYYAIAYLIRNHRLQEANNILTAIYKNKRFNYYADLWQNIVKRFHYTDLDNYSGGGLVSDSNYKQDTEIQNFCMIWVNRIVDEEEQAGALTHILRIF